MNCLCFPSLTHFSMSAGDRLWWKSNISYQSWKNFRKAGISRGRNKYEEMTSAIQAVEKYGAILQIGGTNTTNVNGIVRKVKVMKSVKRWPRIRRNHWGRNRKESGEHRYSFTSVLELMSLPPPLLLLLLLVFEEDINQEQEGNKFLLCRTLITLLGAKELE